MPDYSANSTTQPCHNIAKKAFEDTLNVNLLESGHRLQELHLLRYRKTLQRTHPYSNL